MNYLLDTNIFILLFNNRLAQPIPDGILGYSIITEIELFSFSQLSPSEEQIIRAHLERLQRVFVDSEVVQETIALRKNYGLRVPDAIVVASASVHNATLITNDQQLLQVPTLQTQTLQII